MITCAPSAAKSWAVASPRPLLPPVTTAASLTVAGNSGLTLIGIAAPTDPNYSAAQLTIKVTGLPNDGTVFLADGVTAAFADSLDSINPSTFPSFVLEQEATLQGTNLFGNLNGAPDPNSCKGLGSKHPGTFDGAKFRWLAANVIETQTGRPSVTFASSV